MLTTVITSGNPFPTVVTRGNLFPTDISGGNVFSTVTTSGNLFPTFTTGGIVFATVITSGNVYNWRERVAHALEQIARAQAARRPSKETKCFLGRRKAKWLYLKTTIIMP